MKHRFTLVMCAIWLLLILVAPNLTTVNPRQTDPANTNAAPSFTHPLGTDALGRDVLSRTAHGGQQTLFVSVSALLIATIPALLIAIVSMWQPRLSPFIIVLLDSWLAFPSLLIALIVLTVIGRGTTAIALAVGIAQLPYLLRIALTELRRQQSQPYVEAAQSLGASRWHTIIYHLLPASRPVLASYISITFAYCIINSAALNLLGLGGDPSTPEWGVMLAAGRNTFRYAPWSAIAPAIAISITIMLVNKLADTFR